MNTATAMLIAVGGVCIAALAIATFGRGMWRVGRRLNAFFDDWFGIPARPGRKAVPGIPERVSNLEDQVEEVRDQIVAYDGSTDHLGDRIVRIEEKLDESNDHKEQPS